VAIAKLLREEWTWMTATWGKSAAASPELCSGCGTCVEVCPVGCFVLDDGGLPVLMVRQDNCVACEACVLQCPDRALTMERFR